jgi:hypothetical protein
MAPPVLLPLYLPPSPSLGTSDCDAVEGAVEVGQSAMAGVLDGRCKSWPLGSALAFAQLGLSCKEERRRRRPALESEVLLALGRLAG